MLAVASAAVGEQLAVSDSEEDEEQLFLPSVDSDRGRRLPTRRLFAVSVVMARDEILKKQYTPSAVVQ